MLKEAVILLALGCFVWGNPTQQALVDSPTSPPPADQTKEERYRQFVNEKSYTLPFKSKIQEPFKEGQTIHALGTISQDPKRIDFNFIKGSGPDPDLPLHLSIRFDEGIFNGKIVYNIYENGNWSGDEQRISSPYKGGQPFDIRVRLLAGKYVIYANRKEVGSFEQRLALDGVDHVGISGDLAFFRLFHYGGTVFPNPYTAVANLKPGNRLDISALPTGKRVNINLYRNNGEYALQVSIRYNEGAIVRNAMSNSTWGKEEREGVFPFEKDEIFDLTIINEEFSYQIFANGKRFASFGHRGSPNDVRTLEIDGNVDVHSVTITPVP